MPLFCLTIFLSRYNLVPSSFKTRLIMTIKKILLGYALVITIFALSLLTYNIFNKRWSSIDISNTISKENSEPVDLSTIKRYDPKVEDNICNPGNNSFDKGVVSLTFDDGWKSIYENAIPILNQAGIKSTQYIPVEIFSDTSGKYFSLADALKIKKAGHEIASHAVIHKRFTEIDETQITIELNNSKNLLLQLGLGPIDTFAYPYGEYSDFSIKTSKKYYKAVRTTDPGMNDLKTDRFLLYTYQLQNWMTFPYLKRWVDRAIGDKNWLIFTFHQVEKPDFPYYTSPQDLALLVNYLIGKEVPTMSVRDMINKCYLQK